MKSTPAVFLLFLVAGAVIYPFWATHEIAVVFGAVAQITSLIVASYNASLARDAYARNDEPRKAWVSIALGLWIWVIAQFLEAYCDLILRMISYGTITDAFWTIGYIPMVHGVGRLVFTYRKAGLPTGSRISYIAQVTAILLLYGMVFYLYILGQLTNPERPWILKFLDFYYSGMDFILVGLISILIRFAWLMRGGILARSWVSLGLGFLIIGAGDLWLSYTTDYDSAFYRVNDVCYYSSYFLIAISGMYQVRMLKSS